MGKRQIKAVRTRAIPSEINRICSGTWVFCWIYHIHSLRRDTSQIEIGIYLINFFLMNLRNPKNARFSCASYDLLTDNRTIGQFFLFSLLLKQIYLYLMATRNLQLEFKSARLEQPPPCLREKWNFREVCSGRCLL